MASSPARKLLALTAAAALSAAATPAAAADTRDDLRISDIQDPTRLSPFDGEQVEGVTGVVTAVNQFGSARGFWFQDPEGDGDPRTSEALFVFTASATPDVEPGDEVAVSGQVQEFQPAEGTQSVTQIAGATWAVLSAGNPLPEAELLDAAAVPETLAPDAGGGDISDLELRPEEFALDFWESREHMLVRVEDVPVVGPTTPFNEFWVTTKPEQNPSARGGTIYNSYDEPNSGRLKIESLIPLAERPFPEVDVGDEIAGTTEGPLYYSRFGGYTLRATVLGEHVAGGLEREVASAAEDWELSVATYNVENLAATADDEQYARLAAGIVHNLRSPDILSLEEIQDNNGPQDDGTVEADETLDRLVDTIREAGGPTYEWRQIDPADGQDGGQPGGNIRNAFLFQPDRVDFVDIPGGDATTPVEVLEGEDGGAELSVSPGRIAPENPAWENSRKPLVGQFTYEGRTLFLATNHFNSKSGDQPTHGIHQPPDRISETQRHEQAGLVREWVDDVQAIEPDANVLVLGDLNDFEFSQTVRILMQDRGLYNPMLDLPEEERYGYVFDGNSQALDHILLNRGLAHRADYEAVRMNSEFHDQSSDHDPQVVRLLPRTGERRTDRADDRRYYASAKPRKDKELDRLIPPVDEAGEGRGRAGRPR